MKKLFMVGMLFGISALLISIEPAPMTPSPEQLLEELNMLGIRMVYQPRPLNADNADALLEKAIEKIELIKNLGSKKQIDKAKKILFGMMRMYKIHLRSPARKSDVNTHPPILLAPPFAQAPKK